MNPERKIKIGVVGSGFGASFLFHKHPHSIVETISANLPDERAKLQSVYQCSKAYPSLGEMLRDSDIDAVALFTPAPLHARHTVEALHAGKHVLCAVPAGMSIDECAQVKQAVQRTGLTYMMAETSVYRQDTISVRQFYEQGLFGKIMAAEAEYHHPGLEDYFFDQNRQPTWRHGLPPMLYSTHATAFLMSVTGERLTAVSCIGWGDDSPLLHGNTYNNPFWNETALFNTNQGTAFRINISWRGALLPTERCVWHGEQMSFHSRDPRGLGPVLVKKATTMGQDDAGFLTHESHLEPYDQPSWWQTALLPEPLRVDSGHDGSHPFITHEFVDALVTGRRPRIDVREAIDYTLPGIVAHASALKQGASMHIPSFDQL